MKTKNNLLGAFYALAATVFVVSCQKNEVSDDSTGTDSSSTIAVAATASSTGSNLRTDSVYLLQSCGPGGRRDSIAQSALPAAVNNYLSTNYSGATFSKAFAVKNRSSVLTGYVVVIYYNDKPVGLSFDSTGNFVNVLEQREKGDLNGRGHHHGGLFEHRDGKQRDSVALSALPASVTAYLATNYASDTLVKAFKGKDSSLLVVSKNNGVYATVFDASGAFVKRVQLPSKAGSHQSISLAQLPAIAANYLSQTYPNYVFKNAFSVLQGGTTAGYVVVIDANNTKYAVAFDPSGNFLQAKTIR